MSLRIEEDDLTIELEIRDYRPGLAIYDDAWCKCDIKVQFREFVHYEELNAELLECFEVDNLLKGLNDYLDGKMARNSEISFIEPEFVFKYDDDDEFIGSFILAIIGMKS